MKLARALRRHLVSAGVLLGSATAALAAGTPVALVMELAGTTTPRVDVHQELTSDARIALGKSTRIAVLHYQKCMILTVRGGTLQATEAGIESASGVIESSRPGPCPRVQRVTVAGLASGSGVVLSRAIAPSRAPVSIAANDDIVLTGPLASRAMSFELVDAGGKVVLGTTPVRATTIRLAGGRMPAKGETFELRVTLQGAEQPLRIALAIVEPRADGPLILRLE